MRKLLPALSGLGCLLCALVAPESCCAADSPSFASEVVPILTRLGCNSGACHGKLAGQKGFRLSLRGYAPEIDIDRLKSESRGRRIDLAAPENSLLLRKATAQTAHGGGQVLTPGSRYHQALLDWIRAGADGPRSDEPELVRLEVLPRQRDMRIGEQGQLSVQATYADGVTRDVTWLARFDSGDPGMVTVDADGAVNVLRHGETVVRASFLDQVEIATITVPHDTRVDPAWYAARNNVIDEHVFAKLHSMRIEPAELCSDETFIRRVYLDTLGTLPAPDEVRAFLADPRGDKRSQLVDKLFQRPEFVDFWTLQFADLLQNRKNRDHDARGLKGVRAMHGWLRQQVAENRPWNEMTRDVLAAHGASDENPAIGYIVVAVDTKQVEESDLTDFVAQTFLGTRIGCARCHNHPNEKYTQDDYYHFAAFFSRVFVQRQNPQEGSTAVQLGTNHTNNLTRQIDERQRKRAELVAAAAAGKGADPKQIEEIDKQVAGLHEQIRQAMNSPVGMTQPRTRQFLAPRPLDRSEVSVAPGSDPREPLVDWITSPANANFSGAMVNRLWRHFLGVGLVEPVDDLRASNPPSNAALWKALCDEFVASGYDTQRVMRLILNSRTYQLASERQASNIYDARHYSYYYPRRLPAEPLLDAISQSTGVADAFPGYPLGVRAAQLADPHVDSYFLKLFGRSERITACACERQNDVSLAQLMHLHNGDSVLAKIKSPEGHLAELLNAEPDDGRAIEDLFLRTLSRRPTAEELSDIRQTLADGNDRTEVFQDLFWALLNSKEFSFNH